MKFSLFQDTYILDKRTFKLFSLLLLFFLVVRHAMFYLNAGYIQTEMGFDQSIIGILLLAVTASFGCLFFWGRERINLKTRDLFRLFLIGILPFILSSIANKDYSNLIHYSIYDWKQRPSFLILIPITTAIIFAHYVESFWYRLIAASIILYFFGDVFCAYYFSIFIVFAALQHFDVFRESQSSSIFSLIYFICIMYIQYFQVTRINFFIELIMTTGYLSLILTLARFLSTITKWFKGPIFYSFNVFYFYLCQAVFFLICTKYFKAYPVIFNILLVFVLSTYFSALIKKWEEKLINV